MTLDGKMHVFSRQIRFDSLAPLSLTSEIIIAQQTPGIRRS